MDQVDCLCRMEVHVIHMYTMIHMYKVYGCHCRMEVHVIHMYTHVYMDTHTHKIPIELSN